MSQSNSSDLRSQFTAGAEEIIKVKTSLKPNTVAALSSFAAASALISLPLASIITPATTNPNIACAVALGFLASGTTAAITGLNALYKHRELKALKNG